MGINVKRQDVVDNVHLLASKLGLGITDAIKDAVSERLASLERAREVEIQRRLDAIRRIQEEFRLLGTDGMTSNCDEFYDEDGLPI
jgi:hypothetical protein